MKNKICIQLLPWFFLSIGLMCPFLAIQAQQDNVWTLNSDHYDVEFDFKLEPPKLKVIPPVIDKGPKNSSEPSYPLSIADNLGNLLMYSRENKLFNARLPYDSIILPFSTDTLLPEKNNILPVRFDYSCALPTDNSNIFRVIISISIWTSSLNDTVIYLTKMSRYVITLDVKDKLAIRDIEHLPFLSYISYNKYPEYRYHIFQPIRHKSEDKIWLLFNGVRDTFSLTEYDKKNGIHSNVRHYGLLSYPGHVWPAVSMPSVALSNSGNLIAVTGFNGDQNYVNAISTRNLFPLSNACHLYEFDNEKGIIDMVTFKKLFVTNETLVFKAGSDPKDTSARYSMGKPQFSPDDSILYILTSERTTLGGIVPLLFQLEIADLSIEKFPLPLSYGYSDIKTGTNGKIYILSHRATPTNIAIINKPNVFGMNCKLEMLPGTMESLIGQPIKGRYLMNNSYWPNFGESYKKMSFTTHSYACVGKYIKFTNTSDSIHWERYRFYFGDGDSADMDDQTRLKDGTWGVEHIYKSPGTYFVKLRAFNAAGGWVWYSDSITVQQSPVAKFSLKDTSGCQWVAYDFKDESTMPNKLKQRQYVWSFGDGKDTMFERPPNIPRQGSARQTYTQSGVYNVELVVHDGFCSDTFSILNTVNILPAPRPGITAQPIESCSPMEVTFQRTYSDAVDSVWWNMGDGSTLRQAQGTYSYSYPKNYHRIRTYYLSQKLFGSTGCITTDSVLITVHPQFDSSYVPNLIRASVENDSTLGLSKGNVFVNWNSHPAAVRYDLFLNNTLIQTKADTFYTAPFDEKNFPQVYKIRAADFCKDESAESNIGTIIHLERTTFHQNVAVLKWTPYENWPNGVEHYLFEIKEQDSYSTIGKLDASTLAATDPNFREAGPFDKCYRVTAVSKADNSIVSHSNQACVPYETVFLVPTVFSPNEDGLNDRFLPYNLGIKEFQLSIYNLWGEMIFNEHYPETTGWDGHYRSVPAMQGLYLWFIKGKTDKGEELDLNGTVVIVR